MQDKELKRVGRPREKDYSKLAFEYEDQLKQGVYLIYNDSLDERYVGKTEVSFAERYSVREAKHRAYLRGNKKEYNRSSEVLFDYEDSRMEWLFIPFEKITGEEILYIEKLLIKHVEYHGKILNKEKPKKNIPFNEILNKGFLNIPLLIKYNVMEPLKLEVA